MADETKPQTTTTTPQVPLTELPVGGGIIAPTGAGPVAGTGGSAPASLIGGITLADPAAGTEDKLKKGVPAFGNVLAAIGGAVAKSQQALDKSLLDAVKKLNDTKIDVIDEVIIELDDETGQPFLDDPNLDHTKLVKQNVSVLTYYTPVFHEWKNVSIAMDLSVGGFHTEQGFQFNKKQSNTSIGGGFSWSGAFGGWFGASHSSSSTTVTSSSQSDAVWSTGQLLVDAQLGPRALSRFPVAAEIVIGPQISVAQGKISETKSGSGNTAVVTARSVTLSIQVRKWNGDPDPTVTLDVSAPGLLPEFLDPKDETKAGTNTTNEEGKVLVKLTRDLKFTGGGFRQFPVTITLGDLKKTADVTL